MLRKRKDRLKDRPRLLNTPGAGALEA